MPLLVQEAGSERAKLLWDEADRVAGVRLVYPEGCAALAAAGRTGRLSRSAVRTGIRGLGELYEQMDIVEATNALARRAGALAERYSLCGNDAVHLAAAETLSDEGIVLVARDGALCRGAQALGLAVARS